MWDWNYLTFCHLVGRYTGTGSVDPHLQYVIVYLCCGLCVPRPWTASEGTLTRSIRPASPFIAESTWISERDRKRGTIEQRKTYYNIWLTTARDTRRIQVEYSANSEHIKIYASIIWMSYGWIIHFVLVETTQLNYRVVCEVAVQREFCMRFKAYLLYTMREGQWSSRWPMADPRTTRMSDRRLSDWLYSFVHLNDNDDI